MGFVRVVELLVLVVTMLVLGRVVMSWVDSSGRGQVSRFLYQATEPMLAPIRRLLPQTGMLDLSPMILLFLLSFLLQALR